ncbi:MAG TPA: ABC transporter ATP-binding protein [Candidatus Methanofastidiosa archaeon]|nr:ABC transporter ATP-binding protein [Candidatus Methanofastidiosa archaeon]
MDPMIKIENLTKRYTFKILALKGISLDIERGDCVGFLGPNGAGKSTTIKILTGLIRPTSGTAYIDGNDVTKNKKVALRSVGCLVETPDFYPYLTPIDTLTYLGKIRGVDDLDGRIEEILKMVKLSEWADTRVGSFSKGMKQRLGFGQAMLHDPDLIILDEPSSGLDPKGMAEIRDLINDIRHKKTIFLSSHLLPEVQQIADRVALINKGEILAYDTVDALSKKFFTVKEVEIETLTPLTEEQIKMIGGYEECAKDVKSTVQDVKKTGERRYSIAFVGETEECRNELLKWLVSQGIPLTAFNPKGLALESIYMEMIK